MINDVLVFIPVYRLEHQTIKAVSKLEWDGHPLSILFQNDNPTGNPYADHLHQFKRGREVFLQGRFDALMVIESDIVPPVDALRRLAALDVDVAFGCYLFRHGAKVVNILQRYEPHPGKARNVGESLTLHPGLWESALRAGVVECSGSGLGCILLKRHVVEDVPFVESPDGGFFDWYWNHCVYDRNYLMKAETMVRCGHVEPDGNELWV